MTKANTGNLKKELQQRSQNGSPQQQQGQSAQQQIGSYLRSMAPTISQVLPKHMNPDRIARIAFSEIKKNPQLLECNVASLAGAVMQAATLGLEPTVLGHCYFVPFNRKVKGDPQRGIPDTWEKDVQFIIGYKGYIDLARRSGEVLSINAMEVKENDEFHYEYGLNESLKHIPARKDRGKVTDYYAYAKFKDGGHTFLVMSKEDIDLHKQAFSKSKNNKTGEFYGPWKDNFDSMAKKTVIRNMMKYMPLSIETQEKFNADERTIKEVDENGEIISEMNFADFNQGETIETPFDTPEETEAAEAQKEEPKKTETKKNTAANKKQQEDELPDVQETFDQIK